VASVSPVSLVPYPLVDTALVFLSLCFENHPGNLPCVDASMFTEYRRGKSPKFYVFIPPSEALAGEKGSQMVSIVLSAISCYYYSGRDC